MQEKVEKLAFILPLVLQSTVSIMPPAMVHASNLAEEHFAILTQSHNRVYKRDHVDWNREIWGEPSPAKKGAILREGMQVGTGQKSFAEISWPDVKTRTWENSVVAISPGKRLVFLMNGEMLFQLDKNRKDKADTLVWTRVLQLRIHGTTVLVQAMTDFTRVAVLEGDVDVTNRLDNSVISLKPGAVYEVRTGPAPIAPISSNSSSSPSSFGAGPERESRSPMSSQSQGTQNYANSLNSSDLAIFQQMKARMPYLKDPQQWTSEDYAKFCEMKGKWAQKQEHENRQQQMQSEMEQWKQQKQQEWQNHPNPTWQEKQEWQKQKLEKEQELRRKYQGKSISDPKVIASNESSSSLRYVDEAQFWSIVGEPDIYPPVQDADKFSNLLNSNQEGKFSTVGYPGGKDCSQQQCPEKTQWQNRQGQQCPDKQWQNNQGQQFSPGNQWQSQQGQQWPDKQWQNQQASWPARNQFPGASEPRWSQNSKFQNSPSSVQTYFKPSQQNQFSASQGVTVNTSNLAPLKPKSSSTAANKSTSFIKEIVSWNSPPTNVYRSDRSATNVYLANTDALLSHPLLGASFPEKLSSMPLIQSALARYTQASRGQAGDPVQVRNRVFTEAVAVEKAPSGAGSYETGKEVGSGIRLLGSK